MSTDADKKSTFARLTQIGVVVKDMDQAIERLTSLGIGPFYSKMPSPEARSLYRGQPFNANGRVILKAAQLGNVELELVQPVAGGSPHRDYLEEKGEGIQHIAFSVDNLGEEVEKLTGEGCTILLDGRRETGGVAYLDLNVGGIIVELVGPKRQA